MQPLFRSLSFAAAALAVLFGLTACTLVQNSSPSSFYVLSTVLPEGQKPLFEPEAPEAPTLVVGVVRVASFLDRPQVTIRRNDNLVTFDEFVRWGEPLSDGVARVVRANFVTLLGTPESALPWVRVSNRDFNLFIFVEDIQELQNGQIELRMSFRMSEGQSGQIVLAGERSYFLPSPEADARDRYYGELAQIISEQLGQFSVDIASDAARLKGISLKSANGTSAPADSATAATPAAKVTAAEAQ